MNSVLYELFAEIDDQPQAFVRLPQVCEELSLKDRMIVGDCLGLDDHEVIDVTFPTNCGRGRRIK
jgi:hypothetical protein